jgi:hypothetical protein
MTKRPLNDPDIEVRASKRANFYGEDLTSGVVSGLNQNDLGGIVQTPTTSDISYCSSPSTKDSSAKTTTPSNNSDNSAEDSSAKTTTPSSIPDNSRTSSGPRSFTSVRKGNPLINLGLSPDASDIDNPDQLTKKLQRQERSERQYSESPNSKSPIDEASNSVAKSNSLNPSYYGFASSSVAAGGRQVPVKTVPVKTLEVDDNWGNLFMALRINSAVESMEDNKIQSPSQFNQSEFLLPVSSQPALSSPEQSRFPQQTSPDGEQLASPRQSSPEGNKLESPRRSGIDNLADSFNLSALFNHINIPTGSPVDIKVENPSQSRENSLSPK